MRRDLRLDRGDVAVERGVVEQVALLGAPARVTDHARRPAGEGDRHVAGVLEAAQHDQADQVAVVEAVGGRVAAVVEGDRALPPGGRRGRRGRSIPGSARGRRGRRAGPSSAAHVGTAQRPCGRGCVRPCARRYRAAVMLAGQTSPPAPGCSPSSPRAPARAPRCTSACRRASPPTRSCRRCSCSPRRRSASRCCCWRACTTSLLDGKRRRAGPLLPEPHRRTGSRAIRCRRSAPSARANADELADLLATRSTQTNEIGRCALLLPVARAARRRGRRCSPTSTSAPAPDSTCCSTATSTSTTRAARSAVRHRSGWSAAPEARCRCRRRCRRSCSAAGSTAPPSTCTTPSAGAGWRPACGPTRSIASNGCGRRSRSPPGKRSIVRRGDAVADTRRIVASFEAHPVVTNTWVLNYLTGDERRAYLESFDALGAERDLSWIFLEAPALVPELPVRDPTEYQSVLVLVRWRGGRRIGRPPRCRPSPRLLASLGARHDPTPRLIDRPSDPDPRRRQRRRPAEGHRRRRSPPPRRHRGRCRRAGGRCRTPGTASPGRRRARSRPPRRGGHLLDPAQRLDGAQQHGLAVAVAARDDVGAVVHPVREVDVEVAGRAEHRRRCAACGRRTCGSPGRRTRYASTSTMRPAHSPATSTLPSSSGATTSESRAKKSRSSGRSATVSAQHLALVAQRRAEAGDLRRPAAAGPAPPGDVRRAHADAGRDQLGGLGSEPVVAGDELAERRAVGRGAGGRARRRWRGRRGTACLDRPATRRGRSPLSSRRRPRRPSARARTSPSRSSRRARPSASDTWSTESNSGSLSSWRSRL